jgi:LPXTG-motif cell wall-anchored protein
MPTRTPFSDVLTLPRTGATGEIYALLIGLTILGLGVVLGVIRNRKAF